VREVIAAHQGDDLLRTVVAELVARYGAHTVVLYGSRARGDATPESDIDVAALADIEEAVQDARPFGGTFLDAFVHPTRDAERAEPDALKLVGGRILLDTRGVAGAWLTRLAALEAAGPPPLAPLERQLRRTWPRKMLARIARGDVEAHYRRHWLLQQLLEDWFVLAGRWYPGPKRALILLAKDAPEVHAAFAAALAPDASLDAIARLVEHVVGADAP